MTERADRDTGAGVMSAFIRSVRLIAAGEGRPIAQLAADAAADLVPGTVVVTLFHDRLLTLEATAGPRPIARGIPWGYPGTLASVAVRSRQGQLCVDSRTDHRLDPTLSRQLGALSAIAAPLLHGERCLGTLSAFASWPGAYDEHDLETLCALADVTAARLSAAEEKTPRTPGSRSWPAPISSGREEIQWEVGVWEWDAAQDRVTCSPEMFTLLGLPPDADVPRVEALKDLLASSTPVTVPDRTFAVEGLVGFGTARHLRLTGFDGRVRDVALWTRPERSGSGELVRLHGVGFDLTAANSAASELTRAARTDPVTGLLNRRALERMLSERVGQLAGGSHGIGLMMIDLDRFKLVNDTFGHHVGDTLLRQVGDRLERGLTAGPGHPGEPAGPGMAAGAGGPASQANPAGALGPGDPTDLVAARMGGDEFVVLAVDIDRRRLFDLADRVQELLAPDYQLASVVARARCPASIGMAWSNEPDRSGDQLLREAEVAMYRAKELGRERWVLFNASLRTRLQHRLRAEETLREALSTGRLVPTYQPIVRLSDEVVVSFESLARIRTEDGGVLEPISFIEVAEETGLIREVDAAVMRRALADLPMLQQWAPQLSTVAVNVSAISLTDPTFAESVRDLLDSAGVDPARLALELTERVMVADESDALASMEALRGMGVRVGIDDFGTGYSSLAYLPRLPVQFVKVDQSFVARIEDDERTASVVRAIIALAHAHGLQVTAEGVECSAQARLLREMGCDTGQGLLWSEPRAAAHLQAVRPAAPGRR